MSEVRLLDSIKANARAALDQFDKHGTKPVNPHVVGTDAHKEWALEFYQGCLEHEKQAA